MRIRWELAKSLCHYIRREVDPSAINIVEWAQLHPDGCFGAEVCKCYQTAQVHVIYRKVGLTSVTVEATWVFHGTLAALIQMLDAHDEMEIVA